MRRTKGPPECERIGFRMFDEDDLERAKSHFEARGLPSQFVNVPFQGRTLHGTDAAGTPLEFCARMKTLPRAAYADTNEHRGAGALRISHFQISLPDVAPASAFYCDAGFRVSEYSCVGERVVGALLHRKDNPHDLVLQEGAGPQLHHVGYVAPETYHVMRAIDAARQLLRPGRLNTVPAGTVIPIGLFARSRRASHCIVAAADSDHRCRRGIGAA